MLIESKNSLLSPLKAKTKAALQQRFDLWLARRMPKDKLQAINHKNIFIIPTQFGASLTLFILVLFLLGTNYQNNVIILLSYLLVSFFIVVLIHSFFNLSGLQFRANSAIQGFVGRQVQFPLTITNNKSTRFNVRFAFDIPVGKTQQAKGNTAVNNIPAEITVAQLNVGDNNIGVPYRIVRRGHYSLGRMLIISEYGFGLFRAWTRLDFAQHMTAYPKPISYHWSATQQVVKGDKASDNLESYQDSFQTGQDEFHQLQHYQLGEPLTRVAWKHVARGQGWLTKQYQQALSGKLQLDFDHLPAGNLEQRLSFLSYAIKECSQQQIAFSLKLPNQVIEYDNSPEHTLRCLSALARF
ncbi:MAG: DUF58 domain-containing protein [Cognaticolwellia sp.]